MTNPVMVVRTWKKEVDGVDITKGRGCWVWCPGCNQAHVLSIRGLDGSMPEKAVWEWDGNMTEPTFSPSLLCYSSVHLCPKSYVHTEVCEDPRNCGQTGHLVLKDDKRGHNKPHVADPAWGNCHSFLKRGKWEFLSDSAHSLAGKTVDMVPLPDWLVN